MKKTLDIRYTWDGSALPEAGVARVVLDLSDDQLCIEVEAPFYDDPPPLGAPGSTNELWDHEVVEVFIAGGGEPPYYTEVELSPHGHHLVLQLRGPRQVERRGLPLDYRVSRGDGRWRGSARLAQELLPPPPLRVNAYAVHGLGCERRYLAAYPVPGDGPDFHRLEFFRPLVSRRPP